MNLLAVHGISKNEGALQILDDVSFHQKKFEKVAIAGETGSGKSTLLKIIAGLIQPDSGEVVFNGQRVADHLVPGQPGISYLSQHFELPKFLTVGQVLHYANKMETIKAGKIFQTCRVDRLLERKTTELSGGEKQRVGLARTLIASPQLLLLDEPYSNLDPAHKNILRAVVANVVKKLRISCILVSHDPSDTLSWADKIIVLKRGQMITEARPAAIYDQTKDEYVMGLFGRFNKLPRRLAEQFGLADPERKFKPLLLRPEEFKIAAAGDEGVPGKVKEVAYCGSHLEIKVRISGVTVTVMSQDHSIEVGDDVEVRLR